MFTLTGTLEDHAGKPVADSAVVIIPSPSMTKDSSGNTVYLGGTTVYTDSNGDFTASLVANEGNLVYTVRSAFGGPLNQPIHFNSPADGVTIDLADVVPVQAPDKFESYVVGASAYEVALTNGFVGTETEWLNSLQGVTVPGIAAGSDPATSPLLGEAHFYISTEEVGGGDGVVGHGRPEGSVAAPVGTVYTDLDGSASALRWIKASGTSNTGWRVLYGDTGVRTLTPVDSGSFQPEYSTVHIRRTGDIVEAWVWLFTTDFTQSASFEMPVFDPASTPLPEGFRPVANEVRNIIIMTDSGGGHPVTSPYMRAAADGAATNLFISAFPEGPVGAWGEIQGGARWTTSDPWPTTLPGAAT